MKWSNTVRRLRDGMRINCVSPEVAERIALQLNLIAAPRDRAGRIAYDLVTYVRESK